eukprot:TRINITY_DN17095_c0_g1_i1.p1 TRINITY_DN17095_c0_g1~~TRINITY_DN17095_c0_g1_i1.p1  ORF type:complete len:672 (+),score=186.86 TRINITY_DN17095_c0_g1_i1:51-2018(+)
MVPPGRRGVLLLLLLYASSRCSGRHQPGLHEPPSVYEHCVEIGPTEAGELSNFILEWNLHPDPDFELQLAFHGRANRGFVGFGFDDTGKGLQVITGHPATDTQCVRAMYDNATELNEDGLPYNWHVELPVQKTVTDEWWTHIELERNLSIGITGNAFTATHVQLSLLWAYRWSAVMDGTCQDFRLVPSITERSAFTLDLTDAQRLYRSPVKKKVFRPNEPRCAPLKVPLQETLSPPLHVEGFLEGERHQSKRVAVLLLGGTTDGQDTLHSFGLRSGEEAPLFDEVNGYVKGGESANNGCQDSLSTLWVLYHGFSDRIGGISHFLITVYDDDNRANILVDDRDVGLRTQAAIPVKLTKNMTVRVSVAAVNHAGLKTTRDSHWLRVLNQGKPLFAELFDGPTDTALSIYQRGAAAGDKEGGVGDVKWWGVSTYFEGWWRSYMREDKDSYNPDTDVWTAGTYSYAIGQVGQNVTAVTDWETLSGESFHRGGLDLQHGEVYYFTVRTTNCAGVTSEASSYEAGSSARDGVKVDLVPPVPGVVFDGNISLSDMQYMQPDEPLAASWEGFSDALSGLHHYEWAASLDGTPEHEGNFTTVMGWRAVGLATTASSGTTGNDTLGDLRNLGVNVGDWVYVHVRAFDNAGLWATSSSNGTQIVLY